MNIADEIRMPLIVLVGQTPPPYHGQAIMIKELLDGLQKELDVAHVRMDFSCTVENNGVFGFRKLRVLKRVVCETISLLKKHPGSYLYYPPAPGKWVPVLRDFIFLLCCRRFSGKLILHFHAFGLGNFLSRHRWIRRPWMQPDVAIVLGASARADAEMVQARHVYEIPYGIDAQIVRRTEDEYQSSTDKPYLILFVGHHVRSKGIFDLLETARFLSSKGLCFEMHTVGEWLHAAERERFFKLRQEYGLKASVQYMGQLQGDALWSEYAKADIFFFPTFYENETFGIVLLEAMAYGLPVVTSKWRGPIDVICDGENGFLCDVHDIEAYAESLEKLLSDTELRDRFSQVSLKLYKERYRRDRYIESFRQVFCELNRGI